MKGTSFRVLLFPTPKIHSFARAKGSALILPTDDPIAHNDSIHAEHEILIFLCF
jgi:hypothetical protein